MGTNISNFKGEDNPVENVSWDDSQYFLETINKRNAELKLRLPTEAEWENACRAGAVTMFNFGEERDLTPDKVNFSGKWDGFIPDGNTKLVKGNSPNQWGLYEMHGNVWEWCQKRSARRYGIDPNLSDNSFGFRLSRSHDFRSERKVRAGQQEIANKEL